MAPNKLLRHPCAREDQIDASLRPAFQRGRGTPDEESLSASREQPR